MTEADKERLVALTNSLSLATTTALMASVNAFAREHGPLNAVTVGVDAALTAAVAVLQSAVLCGAIEPTMPIEEAMRARLDRVLALPNRLHLRRPDGSFDPAGEALN